MKISRTFRLFTAIVAIFSVLFMQHAVASYLCPGMPLGGSTYAVSTNVSAMPSMADCIGMDMDQSTLCHVYFHGDAAKQSLDKPPALAHPAFLPVMLLVLATLDVPLAQPVGPPSPIALARPTAPPIAIRNCCFRI